MDFKDYQAQASKTAIYPTTIIDGGFGPAYCALKLAGEAAELMNAVAPDNVIKEGGDVLWYVSQKAREHKLLLEWPIPKHFPEPPFYARIELVSKACQVAEHTGKLYRDQGGMTNATDRMYIRLLLNDILRLLSIIVAGVGATLEQVAEVNLAKLADRAARDKLHGSGDDR